MEQLFLKILNMSITAGWIVIAVLLFRTVFKKAPKWINVCMWALVGIRLVLPFSFESVFSLIPSAKPVPENIMYTQTPSLQTGIPVINSTVNPIISESLAPNPGDSANPMQILVFIAAVAWLIGIFAMAVYAAVSYFAVKRKVREAAILKDNVMICDGIATPFILGIIKPKIYLPSTLSEKDATYVIAHERAHLKRGDHFIKPLGFLLLSVYWFNPLLWAAYVFLCRDIELACDEKVIKDMGEEIKKPYSEALVNCSMKRRMVAACPLAFGETGVKTRVKGILKYKKPAIIIVVLSLIACAVFALCFLTNPKTSVNDKLSVFIDCTLAEKYQTKETHGHASCLDWEVIGTKTKGSEKTLYMWVLYEEYSFDGTDLHHESGAHTFTSVTVRKEDGNYTLTEYRVPRDGSYYDDDIKEMVPFYLYKKALDSQRYYEGQHEKCIKLALEYFGISQSFIGGVDGPSNVVSTKKLTLEDLITLSKKGDDLKWSDFDGYTCYETGSGLYIKVYEIDEMFSLSIGGSYNMETDEYEAMYFYLSAYDITDVLMDIRYGDVEEFISQHKDNPIAKELSASWHLCPVGANENVYSELIKYYGVPKDASLNHILYLNTVKITSTKEFEEFIKRMDPLMDFSLSYPDKDAFTTPSFDSIKGEYTSEYFKNNTLFLVYINSGPPERYTVARAFIIEEELSIGIAETLYASTDTKAEGWLMCVSLSNDDITEAKDYSAFISESYDPDSILMDLPVASYHYTGSKVSDPYKPSVYLCRDGTFQFNFSPLDSSINDGTYAVAGERLVLASHDGTSVWYFDIENQNLVFDKEHSSKIRFTDIPDGAVFELALPYEPVIKDEGTDTEGEETEAETEAPETQAADTVAVGEETVVIDVFNYDGSEAETEPPKKTIVSIVDKSDKGGIRLPECEFFFEKDGYEFYFGYPISNSVIVTYSDGTSQNIKDALNDGNATVYDLDAYGISFYSNPPIVKNIVDKTKDPESMILLLCLIEEFYEDETYVYSFSVMKSGAVVVYYLGGNRDNVKNALRVGYISINDLDKYGIEYFKEPKE